MTVVIWTIYHCPEDSRGHYVARKFVGGKATDVAVAHDELDRVRELLMRAGYTACLGRHFTDDLAIVETWL
jgi:hypothetical protein